MMSLIPAVRLQALKKICNKTKIRFYSEKNPFQKLQTVISDDISDLLQKKKSVRYPEHTDVVIIGGGIIGSTIAYWLKKRTGKGLDVTVIERNTDFPEYKNLQSLGTLIQHYSLHENIYLSLYSADFLRNIKHHLENNNVNIGYNPTGNLVLASEQFAERLEKNVALQKELGVRNEILSVNGLKKRFPWINTEDITLGCICSETEGLFNPTMLLYTLIQKAKAMGVTYVNAEVTDFEYLNQKDVLMEGIEAGTYQRICKVIYKDKNNEDHKIKFAACVLAAGHNSADIAKKAYIGTGPGMLSIPLPLEKKEYNVFTVGSGQKLPTGLDTPRVVDSSGLWFHKNNIQNQLICGHYPLAELDNMKDEDIYSNIIQPPLTNRVPSLTELNLINSSKEWYDYNTYDDTGVLGPHPYHNNLYLAAGFGQLGIQHAPGIGRAITELIIDSHYTTIDLTRFAFDRFLTAQPMIEYNFY